MVFNFKKIQDDFIRLIENERLFHAYLFFGENQIEIIEFSKKLANLLENREFKNPEKFLSDFLIIQPNENGNIGIDEVRGLQDFLYQKSVVSKKKTAIITDAENMTSEAQGSILKIIEEPPQKSLMILIAKNDDLILSTIISRVHRIYFPPVALKNTEKSESNKVESGDIDEFITKQIGFLRKDLIKNSGIIKEILDRYALIKQFNLNKKLQLRFISSYLKQTEHGGRKENR